MQEDLKVTKRRESRVSVGDPLRRRLLRGGFPGVSQRSPVATIIDTPAMPALSG